MAFQRGDDTAVPFDFAVPAALFGVGAELAQVGELVVQDGEVFEVRDEVVAGLA